MAIKIIIPTPLRPSVDNQEEVIIDKEGTVKSVLEQVATTYPSVKKYLFDDEGQLRKFVNFYVNDEDIRDQEKEHTQLTSDDVLSIVPAIAGGL